MLLNLPQQWQGALLRQRCPLRVGQSNLGLAAHRQRPAAGDEPPAIGLGDEPGDVLSSESIIDESIIIEAHGESEDEDVPAAEREPTAALFPAEAAPREFPTAWRGE